MHAVSVRRHAERGSCEARQQDAARRPRDGVGESFFATTCGLVVQVPKVSVPGLPAVAPTARSSEVGGAQGWTPAPPPAKGRGKWGMRNGEWGMTKLEIRNSNEWQKPQ